MSWPARGRAGRQAAGGWKRASGIHTLKQRAEHMSLPATFLRAHWTATVAGAASAILKITGLPIHEVAKCRLCRATSTLALALLSARPPSRLPACLPACPTELAAVRFWRSLSGQFAYLARLLAHAEVGRTIRLWGGQIVINKRCQLFCSRASLPKPNWRSRFHLHGSLNSIIELSRWLWSIFRRIRRRACPRATSRESGRSLPTSRLVCSWSASCPSSASFSSLHQKGRNSTRGQLKSGPNDKELANRLLDFSRFRAAQDEDNVSVAWRRSENHD